LIEEIFKKISSGNSPVNGVGKFSKLNKKYAKDFKGGNRLANLELSGDMKDAFEFHEHVKGVKVGIFKGSDEAPKLHGHNTGGGNLPQRQVIPSPKETFKNSILNKVTAIISEFEV